MINTRFETSDSLINAMTLLLSYMTMLVVSGSPAGIFTSAIFDYDDGILLVDAVCLLVRQGKRPKLTCQDMSTGKFNNFILTGLVLQSSFVPIDCGDKAKELRLECVVSPWMSLCYFLDSQH
jgi:hypothetical protein